MRTATILSLAAAAIALTFMTPAPRASAMTTTVPAAIDTAVPNNGLVEKVRTVCRRYRVRYRNHWVWRTRCYHVADHYRPHRPYRPYRSPHRRYY